MFTYSGEKITTKLQNLRNIKEITIATAFFSNFGLKLLTEIIQNNNIPANKVTVYLSMEFSDYDPAGLLTSLNEIAQTYIVTKRKLHAKVFWFKGTDNLVISGSSNFTQGGFRDNYEMNFIDEKPDRNLRAISTFFDQCRNYSSPVDGVLINAYAETESERQKMRNRRRKLQDMLNMVLSSDEFGESTYPDIDLQYFNFRDYEILFKKNVKSVDAEIKQRRKKVQAKILDINKVVKKPMEKLGLTHHWSSSYITSTIEPNRYNRGRVEWCGVRYTRRKTAKIIKELKLSGEGFGFQKYACLQFCIVPNGFEICLFHAVKNEAVDREAFHKLILNKDFCTEIESDIRKLQGQGLVWYAGEESFPIDGREPGEFIQWYKDNDKDGFETYLSYHFDPDDPRIKSLQSIANEIVKYVEMLIPLFDKVAHQWVKK